MDTQAMTYGGKSTPSDIEAQRAKIPDVKPKEINLITDALKKELKDIINEVLDERELEKKMNGPYDFPDDLL
jgi:hypothetical protein|tara:strand:- start:184 stop:399 length:216 start_codon:yes stop_codon:yes gene_type:complete